MKRLALSAMLGLAMVATAAAQSGSGSSSTTGSGSSASGSSSTGSMSQDQSSTSSGAYGNTSASANKDGSDKKAKLTGCISSQGGSYYLVDKKHPNGVQLLSSEDLSAHVGHKVEVKGSWDTATASSASSSSPSSSASSSTPSTSASSTTPSGSTSGAAPDTSASAGTSGSSAGSGTPSALPQSDQGANQAIRVSEIKMKSDKCEASNNTNPTNR